MTGQHVALDDTGQPVRPTSGPDSLVDPAGPEPDGVTLLWDAELARSSDPDESAWLHYFHSGWSWSPTPDAASATPRADSWRRFGRRRGHGRVVARTVNDDGARPPGRHHASRPLYTSTDRVHVDTACLRVHVAAAKRHTAVMLAAFAGPVIDPAEAARDVDWRAFDVAPSERPGIVAALDSAGVTPDHRQAVVRLLADSAAASGFTFDAAFARSHPLSAIYADSVTDPAATCTQDVGCCMACEGTGSDPDSFESGGRCWDCYGTGHTHVIDPAEPAPVTCEHCAGDGCEDCRGRGVHTDEIAEADVQDGPDDVVRVVRGDGGDACGCEMTSINYGGPDIACPQHGEPLPYRIGYERGALDVLDELDRRDAVPAAIGTDRGGARRALRADIAAGRWPA